MTLLSEIHAHGVRFQKHACILSCYLALGLSLGIVGPTLLDLRHQVGSSLTDISFSLTARAAGYAVGCLCSKSALPLLRLRVSLHLMFLCI